MTLSVSVRFLYATYNLSSKISVCMQGSRERCPVCTHSGAVWYAIKCGVMSHDTSTGLSGEFQASNIGE